MRDERQRLREWLLDDGVSAVEERTGEHFDAPTIECGACRLC